MSNIDIQLPARSAAIEVKNRSTFFHNLQYPIPRWASQQETVSMTAGMQRPRKAKKIEPTKPMNASRLGMDTATHTRKIKQILFNIWFFLVLAKTIKK